MAAHDRLTVDLDGLDVLADRLDRIRTSLDADWDSVAAAAEDLGSDQVESAVSRFEDRRRDGRGKLDNNAATLTSMLRETSRAFRQADSDLAAELRDAVTDSAAA